MIGNLQVAALLGLAGLELATWAGAPVSPTLHMILAATLTIYVGAHSGLGISNATREEAMTHGDAAKLPFVAGGTLVALYVCFQYGNPLVQTIVMSGLKGYFMLVGAGAAGAMFQPIFASIFKSEEVLFTVPRIPYLSEEPFPVTLSTLLSHLLGCVVAGWYAFTSHWVANNVLGVAFCVLALRMGNIGSFTVGAAVLGALFAYDVAMVFGSKAALSWAAGKSKKSIMEVVATKVDGPIKLLFPLEPAADAASSAAAAAAGTRQFSLLGLGDIVFPGILLVLLLRFDVHKAFLKALKALPAVQGSSSSSAAATPAAATPASADPLDAPAAGQNTNHAYVVYRALFQRLPLPDAEKLMWSCPKPYFNAALIAYVLGLAATIISMHWMEQAQPALLYLVPAVLLAPFTLALVKGELKSLLAFEDKSGPEEGEDGKKEGEKKAAEASAKSSESEAAAEAAGKVKAA